MTETTRWCNVCDKKFPIEDFPIRGGRRDHRATCKVCYTAYRKDYTIRMKVKNQDANYRVKYGMSLEEVVQMWEDQDQRCEICRDEVARPGAAKSTHVDHCHATNKVRAVLCGQCNRGLGCFYDDEERLSAAISYLRTQAQVK